MLGLFVGAVFSREGTDFIHGIHITNRNKPTGVKSKDLKNPQPNIA